MSFGKSGRTWLRVMLSRFYQVKHGLGERHLIGFDNLHKKNPAIPKLFFTHDNYIKDYTGNRGYQGGFLRQKGRVAGAQPAGCRRLAILPVEIPHASGQEGAE